MEDTLIFTIGFVLTWLAIVALAVRRWGRKGWWILMATPILAMVWFFLFLVIALRGCGDSPC